MPGRLAIDDVLPSIDGGRFPAKAVVGEVFPVSATVWREGHDAVAATLVVEGPGGSAETLRIPMHPGHVLDAFHASFAPTSVGTWTYRIEAWGDPIQTWRNAVEAKLAVGQGPADLANDLEVGARLFERAADGAQDSDRSRLLGVVSALRSERQLPVRVAPAFSAEVAEALRIRPLRELVTASRAYDVVVDRRRALFGSWYEFFPARPVAGTSTARHGTVPSRPRRRICRGSPRWASTWCTCRRSTRSAR